MSRNFDNFDDDDLDFDKEEKQHRATLDRYRDLDVRVRSAKMEALEKSFIKTQKQNIQSSKQRLAKDFLKKFRGQERPDPDLINFLRGSAGGSFGGVHNREYEPDPTGFEELPWEEDEDY